MYFFFQNPFHLPHKRDNWNNNYENAVTYKMLLAWNALIISAEFTQQQQGTLKWKATK